VQKLFLITNDFGPRAGGIETFVLGLLERIKDKEIWVYTSKQANSDEFDRQWLKKYNVRVIRDRSRILLPTPRVVRNLRKIISGNGIEIIWFGAAAPLGIAAPWLRLPSIKRVVALTHGHEVWWAKIPPFSWLLRYASGGIDYFGFLGEYTKKAISRAVDPKKLVHIAPGIDIKHFSATNSRLRQELQIGDKPAIISVGRLVHRKGQDQLIKALSIIKEAIPDVILIIVGEGPHREVLNKLVKQFELADSVRFLGRVSYDDLPKYLSASDVFAMPSRDRLFGLEVEGLGIVYLEASACELPVIVGKSGGATDALIEGVTGISVDGRNTKEIAHAAIKLLKDKKLSKKMGKAGRKWAETEWSWQIWSKRFAKLLNTQ
jgi:phosphatidylinositol alpha-1,6-mannosyltransferase